MENRCDIEKYENTIKIFERIYNELREAGKLENSESISYWGAGWGFIKFFITHPMKAMKVALLANIQWYLPNEGSLVIGFPLEDMIRSLVKYSLPQLNAVQKLAEIHHRRIRAMFIDNPVFKISLPLGSAYALLLVSDRLITSPGQDSPLYDLDNLLNSPIAQNLMGYLITSFILMTALMSLHFLVFILPALIRARFLDQVIQIAIEEKKVMDAHAIFPENHRCLE